MAFHSTEHNCCCTSLGGFEHSGEAFDLYHCTQGGRVPTLMGPLEYDPKQVGSKLAAWARFQAAFHTGVQGHCLRAPTQRQRRMER